MSKKTLNSKIFSFSNFTEQKARRFFDLKQEIKINLLKDWETQAEIIEITSSETERLQKLQTKLSIYVRGWNEDELKIKFIAPLIEEVNFDNPDLEVASFSERPLNLIINKTEIKGIVDLMVATGISAPEHPFFFIHEYKKEQESSGDAVGQLLATMFVAQELNKSPRVFSLFQTETKTFDHIPIYGMYVIGRFWFFARIKQRQYYISKAYDSLKKEDLNYIFKMLKAQKDMIFGLVKENK